MEGEHSPVEPAEPSRRLVVPTAIVTSWSTASAAEDFMIYARRHPHMFQVGEPTIGSTGQPLYFDLPGGGGARISSKRDTYPDGTDFVAVAVGVEPDMRVGPTVADILAGHDPALERAIAEVSTRLIGPLLSPPP